MRADQPFRLGVDVGGTFTDLALVDDRTGDVTTEKVLTTPSDAWEGIRNGVLSLIRRGHDIGRVGAIIHGTTLVINALIERRGSRVGLITTEGFRDVLHFQRENRYDVYDPDLILPVPLVPRQLRREVVERVGGQGQVIKPLDSEGARLVVRELIAAGAEAIAVSLLHSYLRPDHELALREILRAEAPNHPASLSHEVLPQIREYERTSATVINAYVQPLVARYLSHLEAGLRELGFEGEIYLMTSSGGTISAETARTFPIQIAESGPAAGTLIASQIGSQVNSQNILSFDMGGTTAKSCIIRDLKPLVSRQYEAGRVRRFKRGSGLPLGIPVIDLLEIGAGGGSIAEVDSLGLLRVGPRSSGAVPGPACYGRGGQEPTVTDANVILGLIDPEAFLGGTMRLDKAAARRVIEEHIALPLDLSVEEAASAINRVVTENMAEAARVHSVEVNVDVRNFVMIAFGGAGPIHAAGVAKRLGMSRVIFPKEAGVLSAIGLLSAPLAFEFVRSLIGDLEDLHFDAVNKLLVDLELQGSNLLARAGVSNAQVQRSVDMSYVGQRYEVTTALPNGPLGSGRIKEMKQMFDETYEQVYGRRLDQLAARCVTWRVLSSGPAPGGTFKLNGTASVVGYQSEMDRREAMFPDDGAVSCAVLPRLGLVSGRTVTGPALIQERASTIVIPPRAQAFVDAYGNLVTELADA